MFVLTPSSRVWMSCIFQDISLSVLLQTGGNSKVGLFLLIAGVVSLGTLIWVWLEAQSFQDAAS